MSVVYMVKPYPKSTAGWTIGLEFPAGLSADVTADDTFNTLKLTKISKNRDYFEFQATQEQCLNPKNPKYDTFPVLKKNKIVQIPSRYDF